MAKRRSKLSNSLKDNKASQSPDSDRRPRRALSRQKLCFFRLLALIGAPILFVAALELSLQIAGYGYSTTFLLPASHHGKEMFVQNNQFGWRVFGPRLARLPEPFSIARTKPPGATRIFFFGESAAKGEPQPAFGPARMLQAILSIRHPGKRFEVVNVAMTAINSHVILPIARDCTRADGDIWVIYMGNNEVVGPYGAGTIFGQQTPPLWMIRASLGLKSTRTGQALDSLLARSGQTGGDEWHGMKMFLEQQVRAEDSRMQAVYQHFERNLRDIIEVGRGSGARVVVSTVAVNLRDCAPFASEHRAGLSATQLSAWEAAYQRGIQMQVAGQTAEAASHFDEAAQIDEAFAELRYRQGECALALGRNGAARNYFEAARDHDTLRFRCDSRLNELIRQVATNREHEGILLADSEQAFATESPDGLPGASLFYEHVHPTFDGNYLLATTLARQVERGLLTNLVASPDAAWPSNVEVAERLGWSDASRLAVLSDVLARIKSPPFTGQLNHEIQAHRLMAQVDELSAARGPAALRAAQVTLEKALKAAPDDVVLYGLLATLKELDGNLDGAIASVREGLELLPNNSQAWLQLGRLLIRKQNLAEARSAFAHATELDQADALARHNLAQSLWLIGEREIALDHYRKAVEWQPQLTVAWLGLGHALQESGRKTESEACYQRALTTRSTRATDRVALARFCRDRGWREAAATNYSAAINVSPSDGGLYLEAGQNLLVLKRNAEAFEILSQAARLLPNSVQARTLCGSLLGQQGRPVEAEEQFRAALKTDPAHLEARLNLGIALMSQGRNADALTQLEDVLRRSPTNELASRYVQRLRAADVSQKPQ